MDKAELRRLAEAAKTQTKFEYTIQSRAVELTPFERFYQAANPAAIIELLDEIEAMQCCGNCQHSAMNFSGGSKMLCKMRIMGAMDNYAKEKCDKWQGVK